jgi:predicted Zn-dependent protease
MSRFLILAGFLGALAAAQREPGKGVNFYTVEKEIALGRQLAAEFQRNTKRIESPAALTYVDGIGQKLAAQIGGPPFTYTFALIAGGPTEVPDVAAFPGGFLFVPASLIATVKDEDELAGLLAHAIAHVASRDFTRQATRAGIAIISTMPAVQMSGWTDYGIRQGQPMALPLGFLQMRREWELDADRLAASKMPAAGYDPEALSRYIDREQASYDKRPGSVFPPLPRRAERLEAIRAVLAKLPPQAYPPHEGLDKVQEEVRRLTASAPPTKQPPATGK